jgi:hypothetical protein
MTYVPVIYKSIPVIPGSLKSEHGKQQLVFTRKYYSTYPTLG